MLGLHPYTKSLSTENPSCSVRHTAGRRPAAGSGLECVLVEGFLGLRRNSSIDARIFPLGGGIGVLDWAFVSIGHSAETYCPSQGDTELPNL